MTAFSNTAADSSTKRQSIQTALMFAVPVVALVLYLFYFWFAVLDRYFIFLYFHDMGAGFDTTPFGAITASRYWMSGLVAAGAVTVPYVLSHFVLGRIMRTFRAPDWRQVWLLCAVPLAMAIPALVMTVNDPVMPIANAMQITAVTLIGLALALMPGKIAAERPLDLIWLALDSIAPAFLLLILVSAEDLARWQSSGGARYINMFVIVTIGGVFGLLVMTALRWWRRTKPPSAWAWLAAGLILAYLLLPLIHHVFSTTESYNLTDPGYFVYISDADNFFARDGLLQIGVWVGVVLALLGLTRVREALYRRRMKG
ncbi:MAG: hypothetical protein KJ065_24005 [Anaerolineae bacterium]|nr:hypothetical protein [Anaerolineae bacterium]